MLHEEWRTHQFVCGISVQCYWSWTDEPCKNVLFPRGNLSPWWRAYQKSVLQAMIWKQNQTHPLSYFRRPWSELNWIASSCSLYDETILLTTAVKRSEKWNESKIKQTNKKQNIHCNKCRYVFDFRTAKHRGTTISIQTACSRMLSMCRYWNASSINNTVE